jgi:hypothetical protein
LQLTIYLKYSGEAVSHFKGYDFLTE